MQELNTQIPPDSDWNLWKATAINNKSQIVGNGIYQGNARAFLLIPIPRTIGGNVTYGITLANQNPKSVFGVRFSATGTTTDSASSDSVGAYSLNNMVSGGYYTVTPSKTGNVNGITAFDATLVLRCVAAGNNCALSANQKIAANTDGDSGVTAFDATQIFRYVAANGTNANTGQVGKWKCNAPC